jgi:hypothetical protein
MRAMIGGLSWRAMTDGPLLDPELAEWRALLAVRGGGRVPPGPLGELFAPVLAQPAAPDGCVVHRAAGADAGWADRHGQRSSQWIGGRGDILTPTGCARSATRWWWARGRCGTTTRG